VLAGLGWAAGQPALGLGAALAAMATAYVRAVGRAAGAPSDFRGPMAKQHRMAAVTAVAAWCALAPAALSAPVPAAALWLILAGAVLTAVRRLLGAARALRA
ncbi:MAG: CDP-alcohol phosphatidyltransferase family protein, partial [Janthinobacterium lividum]